MINTFIEIIILTFVVAGMSAIWIHSALFCRWNNLFQVYWEYSEYRCLRKLAKLATCPICSAFWFSNIIQYWFVDFCSLIIYFFISIGVSFAAWLLISHLELNYSKMGRQL